MTVSHWLVALLGGLPLVTDRSCVTPLIVEFCGRLVALLGGRPPIPTGAVHSLMFSECTAPVGIGGRGLGTSA